MLNNSKIGRKFNRSGNAVSEFRRRHDKPKTPGNLGRRHVTKQRIVLEKVTSKEWKTKNDCQIGLKYRVNSRVIGDFRRRWNKPKSPGNKSGKFVPRTTVLFNLSNRDWKRDSNSEIADYCGKCRGHVAQFRRKHNKPIGPNRRRSCLHELSDRVWAVCTDNEIYDLVALGKVTEKRRGKVVRKFRRSHNKPPGPACRYRSFTRDLADIEWARTDAQLSQKHGRSKSLFSLFRRLLGKLPSPRSYASPFNMTLFSENIGELNQKQKHENR